MYELYQEDKFQTFTQFNNDSIPNFVCSKFKDNLVNIKLIIFADEIMVILENTDKVLYLLGIGMSNSFIGFGTNCIDTMSLKTRQNRLSYLMGYCDNPILKQLFCRSQYNDVDKNEPIYPDVPIYYDIYEDYVPSEEENEDREYIPLPF